MTSHGHQSNGSAKDDPFTDDNNSEGGAESAEVAFVEGLQRLQLVMEANGAQIKALAEAQYRSQNRIERIEKMVEENATQIKKLAEAQSTSHKRMKKQMEESREQLKPLVDVQAASAEQLRQALEHSANATGNLAKELKHQRQRSEVQDATKTAALKESSVSHDVRPPPRKLDTIIVGPKSVNGQKQSSAAKARVLTPAGKIAGQVSGQKPVSSGKQLPAGKAMVQPSNEKASSKDSGISKKAVNGK